MPRMILAGVFAWIAAEAQVIPPDTAQVAPGRPSDATLDRRRAFRVGIDGPVDDSNRKNCRQDGASLRKDLIDPAQMQPSRVVNPAGHSPPESVAAKQAAGSAPSPVRSLDCGGGLSLELVLIPAGSFVMGSPPGEEGHDEEEMQHRVEFSRPFYMGRYEVTQAQWQAVMGANPSFFSSTGSGSKKVSGQDTQRFPVEQVSWEECQEFCRKLSGKTGQSVRLPSEAEWEYACRAGTTTPFHVGSSINLSQANFDGESTEVGGATVVYREQPIAVGTFQPSAFGLYDMHGNVWEWCQDWYDQYPGSTATSYGFGKTHRVLRGGSWFNDMSHLRASNRFRCPPSKRSSQNGFRVAVGS